MGKEASRLHLVEHPQAQLTKVGAWWPHLKSTSVGARMLPIDASCPRSSNCWEKRLAAGLHASKARLEAVKLRAAPIGAGAVGLLVGPQSPGIAVLQAGLRRARARSSQPAIAPIQTRFQLHEDQPPGASPCVATPRRLAVAPEHPRPTLVFFRRGHHPSDLRQQRLDARRLQASRLLGRSCS